MYFKLPFTLIAILAIVIAVLFLEKNYLSDKSAGTVTISEAFPDSSVSVEDILNSTHPEKIRSHLEFLADDLLEGRDTGSRGALIAALYLASQFRQYQLLPAVDDTSYFQSIDFFSSRVLPETEILMEIDGEMVPLRYPDDVIVGKVPKHGTFSFSNELVFAGFGISAPEYNYDDYDGIDVADRFVVSLSDEPVSDDSTFFKGEKGSKYIKLGTKRRIAKDNNAAGLVHLMQTQTLERYSWETRAGWAGNSKVSLYTGEESDNRDFLELFLNPDIGEMLFSGTGIEYDSVLSKTRTGTTQSVALGKRIAGRIQVEQKRIQDRNVIAVLPGSDPVLKDEAVLFTAHFDHIGIGKAVDGDSIYNGAADNASGTAAMLVLAEVFASLPVQTRRSLVFIGLTGEEKGLLGAEYYARHPVIPLKKTVACFNMDMIGVGDASGIVVYGAERSSLGDILAEALQQVGLKSMPDSVPEENIFQRSDHYVFAQKGIPSVLTSYGSNRELFQSLLEYYHQPSDEASRAFDYEYLQKHIVAMILAGIKVANDDERPQWAEGDPLSRIKVNGS